jgi:TolA-binding protein
MKKGFLILLAVTSLFTACETGGDQREKRFQKITEAEQEVFPKMFDVTLEKKQHLIELYLAFADEFPQDSLTPELLFNCATIAVASQQEMYAITLYQRIYDEYPNHVLRPIALMEQALVYDNMGDVEHAKPLYEQFLVVFPDHSLAEDVKYLFEMLGKSPEEMELLWQQNSTMDLE